MQIDMPLEELETYQGRDIGRRRVGPTAAWASRYRCPEAVLDLRTPPFPQIPPSEANAPYPASRMFPILRRGCLRNVGVDVGRGGDAGAPKLPAHHVEPDSGLQARETGLGGAKPLEPPAVST